MTQPAPAPLADDALSFEERDRPIRARVELAVWIGGGFVANSAPYGPSYLGEDALYGGEVGVLLRNRITIGLDAAFSPRRLSDGSWGGGYADTHDFAVQTGSLGVGYDLQWSRFHLRPTIGATLVHGVHWHRVANDTRDTTTRADVTTLGPNVGVVLQLDLARAVFLRGVIRTSTTFRVGGDAEQESLMRRDVSFFYYGALGVDF